MIELGKKVVLFPVETVVRELDFRLVLAALCARADAQIVVGRQHLLQQLLLRLEGGVFVGKNLATSRSDEEYRRYKAHGFRTVFLHEEGGLYRGDKEEWAQAARDVLDVEKIEAEDYVCPWGEFQAECYRARHPRCARNIVVTGHPRFGLCSPRYRALYADEVRALRQRHGRFILINTNFLWTNAKGMDFFFRWYGLKPEDRERRAFHLDQVCASLTKWSRFLQLINYLSDRFPDLGIVVRPHPGENIHYYTPLLQHMPRVTITREGSVQAWLLACEAMIHDGCTTAIEAYMAGARVINFHPIAGDRFEITLPNLVGVQCASESEVEGVLRRWLGGDDSVPSVTPGDVARIREVLDTFGSQEDAFEKLAGVVRRLLDEVGPTRVRGVLPVLGRQRVKDALWRLIRPLDPAAWHRRLGKRDRGYRKFPPLERRDVEAKLGRIRDITGRPVSIRFHSSQLLSVFLRTASQPTR